MAKQLKMSKTFKKYVPILLILVVSVFAFMVFKWKNTEHFVTGEQLKMVLNKKPTATPFGNIDGAGTTVKAQPTLAQTVGAQGLAIAQQAKAKQKAEEDARKQAERDKVLADAKAKAEAKGPKKYCPGWNPNCNKDFL